MHALGQLGPPGSVTTDVLIGPQVVSMPADHGDVTGAFRPITSLRGSTAATANCS